MKPAHLKVDINNVMSPKTPKDGNGPIKLIISPKGDDAISLVFITSTPVTSKHSPLFTRIYNVPNSIFSPIVVNMRRSFISLASPFKQSVTCPTLGNIESVNVRERKTVYYMHIVTGVTTAVCIGIASWLITMRVIKLIDTGEWYAAITLGLILCGIVFFSFAIKTIVGCIFIMILGPLKSIDINSQYYSGIKPLHNPQDCLPQVVVHIPVYKEPLESVISKSLDNLGKALDTYKKWFSEKRGENIHSKIIVFDDGLQFLDNAEKLSRIEYYKKHKIAFVARPKTGRTGLFKKASNMNDGLHACVKTTEYSEMLSLGYKEANQMFWVEHQDWVMGGDLRMMKNAIILLVDADTKVPETAICDVVPEFLQDSDLPYTQHYTMPFDEHCSNYWENMISYFTRKIYHTGIGFSTALGDCCPLVGHNAFIRWSYLKDTSNIMETFEGKVRYWSDEHVSEDFELFMRFAAIGKFGRYIRYTGGGFQEGVSLSFIDEVIKMKKFTYGACEMCFNPVRRWLCKGLINKTLWNFLRAKHIKWYSKVNICIYMSTYMAMASAFYYVLAEGIMNILFPSFYDDYMVRSFDVMLTCVFIFGLTSLIGEIVLQWRLHCLSGKSMLKIIWDEIKWIPAMSIFFNSILFHMTDVSFRYFWSIPIEWGATAKTNEDAINVNCWKCLLGTLRVYWKEYVLMSLLCASYSFCVWWFQLSFYNSWSVLGYTIAHMVGPIILNPYIMSLKW